jgi:hypothetical protein
MRAVLAFLYAATAAAGLADGGGSPGPDTPPCISWRAEARYRNYGYDHIVEIKSSCDAPADCQVSTDVAPEAVNVRVNPGEAVEVLTFRGSPAYAFKARVRCNLVTAD